MKKSEILSKKNKSIQIIIGGIDIVKKFKIDIEDIVRGEVDFVGNTALIQVPRKYAGKKAVIIIDKKNSFSGLTDEQEKREANLYAEVGY